MCRFLERWLPLEFGRGQAMLTLKAALCVEEVRIYAVDLVRVNTRNTYPCPETQS